MGDANRTKQGNPKLSAPNRLRRVKVTGLFGIHTVDIEVEGSADPASPRLRIIFDDNGAGKTTVLKAIHHLLSWRDLDGHLAALAELPIDGISAEVGKTTVRFERDPNDPRSCRVIATRGRRSATVEYDPTREDPRAPTRLVMDRRAASEFRDILSKACLPPILVSDDRVIRGDDLPGSQSVRYRNAAGAEVFRGPSRERARSERRDPSDELRDLLQALGQSFLQAAFSSRQPGRTDAVYADMVSRIASDQVKATADVDALRRRAREIERSLDLAVRYSFTNLSQLRQVESTLSGLRRNFRNKKWIATVLEPFFSTLEAEAEYLEPLAARVDLFVSTANEFLSAKTMVFAPGEWLQIIPEHGASRQPLDPAQLSSGERHLLLLLASAMIADGGRLILIDEPELSLGIEWKRKLLSSLLRLTEESQVQFLVASHSVEIISPFRSSALPLRSE